MCIPYKREYKKKKISFTIPFDDWLLKKEREFPEGSEWSLPEISPQVSI